MDNNYLLTFESKNEFNYIFFETEEELKEFVNSMKEEDGTFLVYEALEIIVAREIEL